MPQKFAIETGSVQEMLIIPLYGRKLCADKFPQLYTDTSTEEICARLDYNFSDLDSTKEGIFWQFGELEAAMRQLDMEYETRKYLAAHPNAAIVNMGCGLNQIRRVCDNGTATTSAASM